MHELYSNEYIIRKNNTSAKNMIFHFIITVIIIHLIPVTFVSIRCSLTYCAFNTLK